VTLWFRLVFLAAFAIAVTMAARTAKRASGAHGGTINQLGNEIRALIAIRAALGIVFYAALVAWLFWPRALAWMYLPIPEATRWIAAVLLVPVLAWFAASFNALDTNYRGGVGLYPDHVLVTSGPYRWVRHPIYAAFIAIMCLVLVLSANWVLGGSGLLLVSSIAAVRIPIEERELAERFGSRWNEYAVRTGLLLPRFTASL